MSGIGATDIESGTLQAGAEYALSPYSDVTVGQYGTLDLNGFDNEVNTLSGDVGAVVENSAPGTTATLGVGVDDSPGLNDHDTTFYGVLQDGAGAGQLALAKLGDDMLTLTGTNTYSGQTTVEDGILNVTGSIANSQVELAGGYIIGNGAPQNVTVGTNVTVTSDSSDPDSPPIYGDTVTFTATVGFVNSAYTGYGTPTGSVDFYDETTGADLGTSPLVEGVATWAATGLDVEDHYVLAIYTPSEGSTFLASTSDPIDQTVDAGHADYYGDGLR